MLVRVGPGVCQVDFASLGADVSEGVQDVREVWEIGDEGGGLVIAAVDGPVRIVDDGFETVAAAHSGGFGENVLLVPVIESGEGEILPNQGEEH